jgi:HTH-type transcriptional regulator/antitoxin HigA
MKRKPLNCRALLVERYEDEHWPITTDVDPVSMVRYLLEQGNIKQKDLIPEFGSETAVSLFLSGRRNLTVEQIRKLSARFKLDASIFISAAGAGAGHNWPIPPTISKPHWGSVVGKGLNEGI